MSLTDKKIFPVLDQLNSMKHIKSIRFHTRIITVLPSRITRDLCDKLESLDKSVYLVVHANSHLEFTKESDSAIKLLKRAGVSLLSQSVLLKNVNDSKEKLKKTHAIIHGKRNHKLLSPLSRFSKRYFSLSHRPRRSYGTC